eukprot:3123993-Amphidinium_carterae.1
MTKCQATLVMWLAIDIVAGEDIVYTHAGELWMYKGGLLVLMIVQVMHAGEKQLRGVRKKKTVALQAYSLARVMCN